MIKGILRSSFIVGGLTALAVCGSAAISSAPEVRGLSRSGPANQATREMLQYCSRFAMDEAAVYRFFQLATPVSSKVIEDNYDLRSCYIAGQRIDSGKVSNFKIWAEAIAQDVDNKGHVTWLKCDAQCDEEFSEERVLSGDNLAHVIACLEKKDTQPVPKVSSRSYGVRYFYGIVSPGDESYDELELIAYNSDSSSGTLYYVYLEGPSGQDILLGEEGTVKRERGQIVPDEITGGLGTYYEELKLLRMLAKRPITMVNAADVKPGAGTCHGYVDEVDGA